MDQEPPTPTVDLSPEQKFEVLKMRYQDHVELLRSMTQVDLQVFGGYMTLQLALTGWLAEHPPRGLLPKVGIFLIDSALALIAARLLRNSTLRRKEAVATLTNIMHAFSLFRPGVYVQGCAINVKREFRLWGPWYVLGVVVGIVGVALVLFAGLAS